MASVIVSGEQYYEQKFSELELGSADLHSSQFNDCTFELSKFTEARLTGSRWVDCVFSDCDLSLVDFSNSALSGVRFERCKLVGVNWTLADWDLRRLDDRLHFNDCNLSHSTFIGLKLHKLEIIDCQATNLDFRGADLFGVDFSGSDLTGTLFGDTDLRQADFRSARNYSLSPLQNKLKDAAFSLPEAMSLLYQMDIRLEGGWEATVK